MRSYGLRPDLLAMTQVWHRPDTSAPLVASKGAPEAIARLCGACGFRNQRATPGGRCNGSGRIARVGRCRSHTAGQQVSNFSNRIRLSFGLVGPADPLRERVPEAVRDCRSAGIRVVMITGDYPATAQAIARQAGIEQSDVLTGDELRTLDDVALATIARKVNVFARIVPEQKLRIVRR